MTSDVDEAVAASARQAAIDANVLARASDDAIDNVLREMARLLLSNASPVLEANAMDVVSARKAGVGEAIVDRLMLDEVRLKKAAESLEILADVPAMQRTRELRRLDGELTLMERRLPIGVVGANFEARPNVTLDIASQLIKSKNAGVLRTGSAALQTSAALIDVVVSPALVANQLPATAISLIRSPDHEGAQALVRQSNLIPLVILRGSGESTRALAAEAAKHGVRTLAHAEGGGVLYIDVDAELDLAMSLIESSLDRLGVCNRLNLLLVHRGVWGSIQQLLAELLNKLSIEMSMDTSPLGHEWALDSGNEATISVHLVADVAGAADIANVETSGLAAGIVTSNPDTARVFIESYRGTGVFWNATTRLLDGFKLFALPETGINLDSVPGPRGPVTFEDLYIRQLAIVPSSEVI